MLKKKVDFIYIANNWIQGKILDNGSITHADPGRGGWDNLQIHADSTITFSTGYMCGFGSSKSGRWVIDQADSTLTIHYTQKKDYHKQNVMETINEVKKYKIVRLSLYDIILAPIPNTYNDKIAFVVATNQE